MKRPNKKQLGEHIAIQNLEIARLREIIRNRTPKRAPRNYCDHGHETTQPVKLLPYGGGGNMIVCHHHFLLEIAHRREFKTNTDPTFEMFPSWENLKTYETE